MKTTLPLDDATLTLIEEALNAGYEVDENGTHRLVGAEFSLNQLLDFFSGYDANKAVDTGENIDGIPVFEYPDPVFSTHDLIRALVSEVRALRAT